MFGSPHTGFVECVKAHRLRFEILQHASRIIGDWSCFTPPGDHTRHWAWGHPAEAGSSGRTELSRGSVGSLHLCRRRSLTGVSRRRGRLAQILVAKHAGTGVEAGSGSFTSNLG